MVVMKRATRKIRQKEERYLGEDDDPTAPAETGSQRFGAESERSVAIFAKGLSDENRLRILVCVCGRKKSVSTVVEEVGLSQPLVSHHLKELKRCLLVTVERSGPFIYYEAADPRILDVVQSMALIATDLVASRKTL
jgi:DNA-binding transcriptional ArsR family regulator